MSFERFAALVRAYGVKAERWPGSERTLFAEQAATKAGRALLREESKTESLMQAYAVSDSVSPGLLSRLYAIADVPDFVNFHWEQRFLRFSAFSCAACLIAGLLIGLQCSDRVIPGEQPLDAFGTFVLGAKNWRGSLYDAILPE